MPRGRHRHSPPLHKLLPPMAVAGAAVLCAAGAWFVADAGVLRGLVAATAAAALTGAVFMRSWDESAGRRVADLTRARESDQWKTEERIAELEADVDESRELRLKLDAKLRAKRIELAGLRGEHAALLRRYATAETERATALEGRRRLAIEAATPPKALPAAGSTPTASAYLRAIQALDDLPRSVAAQQAKKATEAEAAPGATARSGPDAAPKAAGAGAAPTAEAAPGATAQADAGPVPATGLTAEAAQDTTEPGADDAASTHDAPAVRGAAGVAASAAAGVAGALSGRESRDAAGRQGGESGHGQHGRSSSALPATRSTTASAIAPYSALRRPARRPGSGFDFFGTQAGPAHKPEDGAAADADDPAPAAELTNVEREDLADVVGEEAIAERQRAEERGIGQVIDLTEHDETERLARGRVRSATG